MYMFKNISNLTGNLVPNITNKLKVNHHLEEKSGTDRNEIISESWERKQANYVFEDRPTTVK